MRERVVSITSKVRADKWVLFFSDGTNKMRVSQKFQPVVEVSWSSKGNSRWS